VNALRDGLADQLQSEEVARKELALDKYLIQLIQLACKAGHLQKAVDGVLALHHKASFDGASKIAGFYQLAGLQEKISKVKEAYSRRDRREEERSSRQSWYRHAAPIAGISMGESSSTGRLDASLNQPLQSGMRKPLRLAESSTNTHSTSLEPDPATVPMDQFWDETGFESSTLGDSNKRKRDGNESQTSTTAPTYGSASIDPAPKRRVIVSGDADLDSSSSAQRLGAYLKSTHTHLAH
jgi:chromosome transmission fidelity protein 4